MIFCRKRPAQPIDGDEGCIDLGPDVVADPERRIVEVLYWGFPADRRHLDVRGRRPAAEQLSGLARTLPLELG